MARSSGRNGRPWNSARKKLSTLVPSRMPSPSRSMNRSGRPSPSMSAHASGLPSPLRVDGRRQRLVHVEPAVAVPVFARIEHAVAVAVLAREHRQRADLEEARCVISLQVFGLRVEQGQEREEAEDDDDLERHHGLERVVDLAAHDQRHQDRDEAQVGERLQQRGVRDALSEEEQRRRGAGRVGQPAQDHRGHGVAALAARYGNTEPKSSSRYANSQNPGPGSRRNLPVKIGSPV